MNSRYFMRFLSKGLTNNKRSGSKKLRGTNVLPTRKARAPPIRKEGVVVLSNGATYPSWMGHPAFAGGKVTIGADIYNTLNWISEREMDKRRAELEKKQQK
eukprot:snap_masked-scaffold_11-processed-gene-11.9-mRNA-1 protein AED:1.00 eAED:1.00 QI:0/-1/0/0/-1/1/1/0/100